MDKSRLRKQAARMGFDLKFTQDRRIVPAGYQNAPGPQNMKQHQKWQRRIGDRGF